LNIVPEPFQSEFVIKKKILIMKKIKNTSEKTKTKAASNEKPKGPEPEDNTSAKDAKKVSVTKQVTS
jgi:hypothetical protein